MRGVAGGVSLAAVLLPPDWKSWASGVCAVGEAQPSTLGRSGEKVRGSMGGKAAPAAQGGHHSCRGHILR